VHGGREDMKFSVLSTQFGGKLKTSLKYGQLKENKK